jgi:UDP-N-acetyl-2-amino-2-deoxyglucuronate dehydrogenase
MSNDKNKNMLNFAVVGCGHIGPRHLAILEAEPRAEISAVCDIDLEKCKHFSSKYHVPYFTDYTEMLKKVDADVISICTPHHLHMPMAIEAANVGKHILVEKPMALHSKDAKTMVKTARKNRVELIVVMQNRYNVPVVLAKKTLDGGHLGKIYMTQCNVLWNRNKDYYLGSNWRGKKDLEGGALFTQASHFIDLLVWFFGNVEEAQIDLDTMKHPVNIEDCGAAIVRFETGVLGTLTWTTCVYNTNYEGSITIIGDRGTIKIGGKYLNTIEYWDVASNPLPENISYTDTPNHYGSYQGSSSNHDKVIHDVVAHLLGDPQKVVANEEAIRSVEAIEKIYASVQY